MPSRSPAVLQRRFIALALLTVGFAAPAHAQSNKQIISGAFYEDRAFFDSFNPSFAVTFAQTPTNQFLNITNVSCSIIVGSSQIVSALFLEAGTTSGANDLGRPYSILETSPHKHPAVPNSIPSSRIRSTSSSGPAGSLQSRSIHNRLVRFP
jgi:hypothetical protein